MEKNFLFVGKKERPVLEKKKEGRRSGGKRGGQLLRSGVEERSFGGKNIQGKERPEP